MGHAISSVQQPAPAEAHRPADPPTDDNTPPLPRHRQDLIIAPHSAAGEFVIKDPVNGAYYHLGPEESLLLRALDGRSAEVLCRQYEERFAQPLTRQDIADFIELADSMNLLVRDPLASRLAGGQPGAAMPAAPSLTQPPRSEQSILFWRVRLFDPDKLFGWLEPRLRLLWTPAFLFVSASAMLAAFLISWSNRAELVSRFTDVLSWQTFVIAWLAIVIATTCHEFAHGLTCKHFGGEVHDLGFLLLFFMPAFYANVSDAWLFREKSRRLWVTLAGGYCDLCLWAIAVFVWRLTMQDSLVNYFAWVIMTICGVRSFFNFLPLIKLDGYYLLSDLTSTPNLRQRGWEAFWGHVRWLLWGAPRPLAEPRRAYLIAFGAAVWLYSLSFLAVLAIWFIWWLGDRWGPLGTLAATGLAASVFYRQFDGLNRGEVKLMWRNRKSRLAALALAAAALVAVMVLVPLEERATGTFQLRAATRLEVRAPMAGYLREVHGHEGARVAAGTLVARMHIPDLESRIVEKRAAIGEQEGRLRLLRFGSRPGQAEAASESQAMLTRLKQELSYLEDLDTKLLIYTGVAGVISTPRLHEKIGQYFNDGDLICTIEETAALEVQIEVPEQEVARVRAGQQVLLKARALPFEQFRAIVDRIAPVAEAPDPKEGQLQSMVPVYCRLTDTAPETLRPGMTGIARISCGNRAMGRVLGDKALRYVRTEFWW